MIRYLARVWAIALGFVLFRVGHGECRNSSIFPQPPNVQGSIDFALSPAKRRIVRLPCHRSAGRSGRRAAGLGYQLCQRKWPADRRIPALAGRDRARPWCAAISRFPTASSRCCSGASACRRARWPCASADRAPVSARPPSTSITVIIAPVLVTDISQIGPRSTATTVSDSLVFETRAYDPRIGTRNGDGIESVRMSIIDRVSGEDIFWGEPIASSEVRDGHDLLSLLRGLRALCFRRQ